MKHLLLAFFLLFSPLLPAQEEPPLPKELKEQLEKSKQVGDTRFFNEFVKMIFLLGLLIALLFLGTWFMKRISSTRTVQLNESSNIKVLDQRQLGHNTIIYVLEIYGKNVAVGQSGNGLTLLADINKEEIDLV